MADNSENVVENADDATVCYKVHTPDGWDTYMGREAIETALAAHITEKAGLPFVQVGDKDCLVRIVVQVRQPGRGRPLGSKNRPAGEKKPEGNHFVGIDATGERCYVKGGKDLVFGNLTALYACSTKAGAEYRVANGVGAQKPVWEKSAEAV
jgi:hypothetical protein